MRTALRLGWILMLIMAAYTFMTAHAASKEYASIVPGLTWVIVWSVGFLAMACIHRAAMRSWHTLGADHAHAKCGHCNSRKVDWGYWNRGWNYLCEQAAGAPGLYCRDCQKITWDQTDDEIKEAWPDWCKLHSVDEIAQKREAQRQPDTTQELLPSPIDADDVPAGPVNRAELAKWLAAQQRSWLRDYMQRKSSLARGISLGNAMAYEEAYKKLGTMKAANPYGAPGKQE